MIPTANSAIEKYRAFFLITVPEGIGRCGLLILSISESNTSFIVLPAPVIKKTATNTYRASTGKSIFNAREAIRVPIAADTPAIRQFPLRMSVI